MNGRTLNYDALLLATGSEPVRLPFPQREAPHLHYLRTLADSRAIIKAAEKAKTAVVVGSSFIGLEVAASLRARGLDVSVVSHEALPLARVLGPELGWMLQRLHQDHGVHFHLNDGVAAVGAKTVTLKSGPTIDADLVVVGIGVRPGVALGTWAKLKVENGIVVDEQLRTSAPGVWAAGDVCRWPDPWTGERIRSEHWVVGQRQGQTAARNMLGRGERFVAAPFFWSAHYEVTVSYVGHAEKWDAIEIDGDPRAHDCTAVYRRAGRPLAVATIARDRASLRVETAMEDADLARVEAAIRGQSSSQSPRTSS
jgi:NADPH-dependent 2,4-dienoyl-CoA reductase/sulfur reductase-like enzyme